MGKSGYELFKIANDLLDVVDRAKSDQDQQAGTMNKIQDLEDENTKLASENELLKNKISKSVSGEGGDDHDSEKIAKKAALDDFELGESSDVNDTAVSANPLDDYLLKVARQTKY